MNTSRVATLSLALVVAAFALGYASPALAGKDKECPAHPSCKGNDDGGGEKALFSVYIIPGIMSGASQGSHPWWIGPKHGIGESDPYKDALVNFDVSYFANDYIIPGGTVCFDASTTTVREASIRGRRGVMESMFWFHGKTNDGFADTVTYILHMDGTTVGDFPPASLGAESMITMDSWRINVANGQSDVEPFACEESSGGFDEGEVMITVTAVPPPPET